jgi:PAS domain S-box-containing protein
MAKDAAKRILLVEDEAALALTQKRELEKHGFKVVHAHTGEDAVRLCAAGADFDLVLMDVEPGPGIDGAEAARLILEERDLPLVFLSSRDEAEAAAKAEKITPYGCVGKDAGMAVLGPSADMAIKLHDANRRRAEAAREAGERRYRDLIESAADGIIVASSDGVVTETNQRMCELLGLGRERVIGKKVGDLPLKDEGGEPWIPRPGDPAGDGSVASVRAMLRVGGSETPLEIRMKTMPDGSTQSILRDAADLLAAEKNLAMKTMFLEAVVNSSADGILVVDPMGKKVFQNGRTLELWKIDPEVAADPDGSRQVAHVMGMTKNPQQFFDEIEHQKRFPLEINVDQLELTDGTVLHRHSAPVLGAEGRLYGRIYHFHDVTGFRRAEEKIRGLLSEKETLLREVHHRIKNYMNTLAALLTLQASTVSEPAAVRALQDAQIRVHGMMRLYDKLYASNSAASNSLAAYLPPLVDEIIANFPAATAVAVEKDIDDFLLDAKSLRTIGIVVNELLTNIMKYAFAGRAEGVVKVAVKKAGRRASLTVSDNGVGMPAAVDIGKGSGFGLMLVEILAAEMGGSIRVERRNGTAVVLDFDAE